MCESATILIIEDSLELAAALRNFLEYHGCQVLLAGNGSAGMQILNTAPETIDLVILDWILPDMSGEEWLECISQTAPEVSVLFWSGQTMSESVYKQIAPKVKQILKKPLYPSELLAAIRRALHEEEGSKREVSVELL